MLAGVNAGRHDGEYQKAAAALPPRCRRPVDPHLTKDAKRGLTELLLRCH